MYRKKKYISKNGLSLKNHPTILAVSQQQKMSAKTTSKLTLWFSLDFNLEDYLREIAIKTPNEESLAEEKRGKESLK